MFIRDVEARHAEPLTPALRASSLSFGWNGRIIGRLEELELAAGEIIVLRGPSGIGKSTLLLTLAGLQRQISGSIDLTGRSAIAFQDPWLIPSISALSNVLLANLRNRRGWRTFTPWSTAQRLAALEAMDELGVRHCALAAAVKLSGGERRRVSLARALVQKAQLYLLDEPTAHLDERSVARVITALRQRAESGAGFVVTSHEADLATRLHARELRLNAL